MKKKIQGNPYMENQQEFIDRQLYNFSDTKMDKPKHMNNKNMISYDNPKDDFELIYKTMTPFEKGHFNATQKKKIKIKGSDPSSMILVAGTMDEDKEWFEEEKKKGKIPINIDFDKWMDEKEDFELGGDPEARLKKQRLLMEDNILSGALQKIDMAMSGIMSTLNLAGGGKVVDLSQYRKSKEPAKVKQLNLADYFKVGIAVADLNESERRLVNDLLDRTLGKNPK
jgi:hypothetical protein